MTLTMTLRHVTLTSSWMPLAGSLAWALSLALERDVAGIGMLRHLTSGGRGGWGGWQLKPDAPRVKVMCQHRLLRLLQLMVLG